MKTGDQNIAEKYKSLKQHLGHLHPHYLDAFEYRLGLTDGMPHSQIETGKKFGVSGSRIRQLEERVKYELEKLEAKKEGQ